MCTPSPPVGSGVARVGADAAARRPVRRAPTSTAAITLPAAAGAAALALLRSSGSLPALGARRPVATGADRVAARRGAPLQSKSASLLHSVAQLSPIRQQPPPSLRLQQHHSEPPPMAPTHWRREPAPVCAAEPMPAVRGAGGMCAEAVRAEGWPAALV